MDIFTAILSGFGLAAPAGLNAWLPLLIVGLAERFKWITLTQPFNVLGDTWVLAVLAVLLLIEVFADKIPAVDTVNDMIHTVIRPVAGGVLFAAHNGMVGGLDPKAAFVLGLLAAGSVHAVKATSRPLITVSTGGIGNPLVSFLEDMLSAGVTILALAAPIVAAVLMLALLLIVAYVVFRWRARRRRKREARI
jgi:hypothetical protein